MAETPTRIGSHEMAATLWRWADVWMDEPKHVWARHLPIGWRYIGRGANRIAFLGPDGYVYKYPATLYGEECSRDEYRNMIRFAGEPWATPVEMFRMDDGMPIVRMPYVQSDGSELSEEGVSVLFHIPILDVLGNVGNYQVIAGMPVVIDAGDVAITFKDPCPCGCR